MSAMAQRQKLRTEQQTVNETQVRALPSASQLPLLPPARKPLLAPSRRAELLARAASL